MSETVQYPQYSSDGVPLTYVPNPFAADGKPADDQWKTPVRTHTTGDIVLSGLQTLDGISVMEGDRVLVKDQVMTEQNGIYVASAGSWRRAPDMYLWPQFVAAVVAVQEGDSIADTVWVTEVAVDGTVGVTPVYWVSVQAATGTLPTFTPLRALISNVTGEPAASPTTSQEIAFLSGVTAPIKTSLAALSNQAASAFTIAVAGTNAAAAAQVSANAAQSTASTALSTGSAAYVLAQTGTNLAIALGDKYVRTTRFNSIGAGTSGAASLPANSIVVLDDFGGATDAVISTITSGRPTFAHAFTTTGAIVTTTFDAAGNYAFSGTPSAYPVALVFRVRQKLSEFDSTSTDIVGAYDLESNTRYTVVSATAGTSFVPASTTPHIYFVDTTAGDVSIVLPDALTWEGNILHVKKTSAGTNVIRIYSITGTATVDQQLIQFIIGPLTSLMMSSDRFNWYIL